MAATEKKNTSSKSEGRTGKAQSKGKSDTVNGRSSKRKAGASNRQKSPAPFVLVIMVLVTVILFLVLGKTDKAGRSISGSKQNKRTIEIIQPKLQKEEAEKQSSAEKKNKEENGKEDKNAQRNQHIDRTDVESATKEKKFSNVGLWFFRFDEKTEKLSLVKVQRKVEGTATLREAMKELLAGPSAAESRNDYLTALPKGLKAGNIRIANKTAEIDFPEALGSKASGTILMNRIDQIVYTATQFDDIDSVIITINGERRNTLGSDGLSIQGPLHRKN